MRVDPSVARAVVLTETVTRHMPRHEVPSTVGAVACSVVPETLIPEEPDYEAACSMHPDELWAEPGNNGREQDPLYVATYQKVRAELVDMFRSGNLYGSAGSFAGCLKRLHRSIAESGVYRPLTGRLHLRPEHYGEFDTRYGRFSNVRLGQSLAIVPIAQNFGDPYGANGRFGGGYPNTESMHVVELPGISPDNLPYDIVRYGADGQIKEIRDGERALYSQGGYEYMYPDVEGVGEYLSRMQQIGDTIERAIKSGAPTTNEVLSLIAQQYQYGACGRPFVQINNSLLMQLANMQVKLLGLPGMTHGCMDIAAQRMQPGTFACYFVARAHDRAVQCES